MSIYTKIDNIPASFLCDTGAAITAISSAFYKQVPSLTKHPPDTLGVQSIKTVNGEIVPVQGLALIPFQIGESIYPFYAYIVKNLAYVVILGADFLTYNNSTINFDSNTIELPPPTDIPPPCATYAFSCSVHASLTCILPPFSESILPAVLNDSLLTATTSTIIFKTIGTHSPEAYNLREIESPTPPFQCCVPIFILFEAPTVCAYNTTTLIGEGGGGRREM